LIFDFLGTGLWVFFIGCFWFSDLGHMFEKLIGVDISFFFQFHPLMLFILKNRLYNFLQFSFNQVVPILWTGQQVWPVDPTIFQVVPILWTGQQVWPVDPTIFQVIFYIFFFSFIIQKWILFKIKLRYFFVSTFIRLSCFHDPAHAVWQSYLSLQVFYFCGLFVIDFFLLRPFSFRLLGIEHCCFYQLAFYEVGSASRPELQVWHTSLVDSRYFIFYFIFINFIL